MRRQLWGILIAFVAVLALAAVNVGYVTKVERDAERRNVERSRDICGIIVLIDDRQQTITPTSEDQRRFIDEVHRYRLKLGC